MKNIYWIIIIALADWAHAAQWTAIVTPSPSKTTKVQCNHWGWIKMNDVPWTSKTVNWSTPCTPLQVSVDGQVFTIADTTNVCEDEKIASYYYSKGDHEIRFVGCYY